VFNVVGFGNIVTELAGHTIGHGICSTFPFEGHPETIIGQLTELGQPIRWAGVRVPKLEPRITIAAMKSSIANPRSNFVDVITVLPIHPFSNYLPASRLRGR
jgi:hypothetical protein